MIHKMNRPLEWVNTKIPNPISIFPSEMHVWKLDLGLVGQESESLITLFSKEEKRRLKSFKFKKDRLRYRMTHYMKRLVIANYLNELPEKLNFTLGNQGKPAISAQQNWLNLQFNISHSHQIILMGVTLEDPIGIDTEYHAEDFSVESLGEIIFSPYEKQFFLKLTCQEKKKAFFRCWTRKEAYLKAKGCGIINYLAKISVDMNELPVKNWLRVPIEEKTDIIWKLFPLNICKFYTTAIVSTYCKTSIKCYNFDILKLMEDKHKTSNLCFPV